MANINLKNIPFLQNTDVTYKTCVVRLDLNVPLKDGKITDQARITACVPTLDYLIKNKAKIIILSHLSRVKKAEDITSGKKSLAPVAKALKALYPKMNVIFVKDNTDKKLPAIVKKVTCNDIILLENTRYNDFDLNKNEVVKKESKCDPALAKFWASLGEVYVNDAFATIHRKHASNAGIAENMKSKCIGFLIQEELSKIVQFNEDSNKPIISVVGGAKIADKIILLEKLMTMSDQVIIGGGMAFTFLKALGVNCGKSIVEEEMIDTAKALYKKYEKKIVLPLDLLVSKTFENTEPQVCSIEKIPEDMMGLDVGPKTVKKYQKVLSLANTIFWNGPTGVFEFDNYAISTKAIANAIADRTVNHNAFSLIGGGDTAAAAVKFAPKENFSWVSTGGGATLSIIQGDKLPGLFTK